MQGEQLNPDFQLHKQRVRLWWKPPADALHKPPGGLVSRESEGLAVWFEPCTRHDSEGTGHNSQKDCVEGFSRTDELWFAGGFTCLGLVHEEEEEEACLLVLMGIAEPFLESI